MTAERPTTLTALVRDAALRFGSAPALVRARGAGGGGLSYAQLQGHAALGARALAARGIAAGDRVILCAEPGPHWAAAFFAILESGAVAVPMPHDIPAESLAAVAARTEARAVVGSDPAPPLAGPPPIPIAGLWVARPAGAGQPTAARADDLAVLAFTSGCTTEPRAVELTHQNLLADLYALLAVRRAEPGDVFLSVLPPAHLFELVGGLLGPLACGARIVHPGPPLPNRLVDALREDRITHSLAVPALLDAVYDEVVAELALAGFIDGGRPQTAAEAARRLRAELTEAEVQRIRHGVRERIGASLHTVVVGGAAVDPALAEVFLAHGIGMEIGYGLTEAGPIVSVGHAGECPAGSVGRSLPGIEVRIGADGEIQVRGQNVMRGYFRDPDGTAAALRDGWLSTGDRGHLDAAGFLFVEGRLKETMVTASGETIHPEEIEPYYQSPLFLEMCVAPVRDAHGNDAPTLFVVPAGPGGDGALERGFQALRAAAPARLRVQRMIRCDAPLPRTPTGKIRRRQVGELETG